MTDARPRRAPVFAHALVGPEERTVALPS